MWQCLSEAASAIPKRTQDQSIAVGCNGKASVLCFPIRPALGVIKITRKSLREGMIPDESPFTAGRVLYGNKPQQK